jgi:hypothetical protein
MNQMAKLNSRKNIKKICFMRTKFGRIDFRNIYNILNTNAQTYYNRAALIGLLSLVCEIRPNDPNLVSSFTHYYVSLPKGGGRIDCFFIYDLNDFGRT